MNFTTLKYRFLSCFLLGSIFLIFFPAFLFSFKELIHRDEGNSGGENQEVEGTFLSFPNSKQELIEKIESFINSSLHTVNAFDFCIDVYGLSIRWLDLQIIHDAHLQIVRQTNDALTLITPKHCYSDEAQKMVLFQERLKEQNIPFVLLIAPHKVSKFRPLLPKGCEDCSNSNADDFLRILSEKNVPYLDFREILKADPATHDRMFYKADTHWTEEYAFQAFCELAGYLRSKGFEIPQNLTDIHSYSFEYPPNRPLAGISDRLGKYYKVRPDSLLLLVPKRKPNIRLDSPAHQFHYSGPYSALVVNDHYTEDGIIINEDSPNKKKILFFSDSFGNAFVGFLALSCSHLECCRMNNFHGVLLKRIRETKPDYVIGLFTARDTFGHCEKLGINWE